MLSAVGGALQLVIRDAYGNRVADDSVATTITASVKTKSTGGEVTSITGTTATSSNGYVTLSNLVMRAKVANYVLKFTASNAGKPIDGLSVDSDSITVTPGAAYQLDLTTPATGASSGAVFTTQPKVTVQDISGNTVNTTAAIIASVEAVNANGTTTGVNRANASFVGGRTSVAAVGGVGDFGTVVNGINQAIGLSGTVGYYRVTYNSSISGLYSVISQIIQITPGAPAAITLENASSIQSSVVAGVQLSTAPILYVRDAAGNHITTDNVTTARVSLIVNPSVSDTVVTTSANISAVNGVLTFTGLNFVATPDTGYRLKFTRTDGSTAIGDAALSNALEIKHAPAHHLVIVTQPSGATSGTALTTQPVLKVVDQYGYTVYNDSSIRVKAELLNAASTDVFSATSVTVDRTTGLVTFTDATLAAKKGNYKLRFTAQSLNSSSAAIDTKTIDSDAFALTHGVATQIKVTTPAAGAKAGYEFSTQPIVQILDAQGNLVDTGNDATRTINVSVSGTANLYQSRSSSVASAGVTSFHSDSTKALGLTGTAGSYTLTYTLDGTNITDTQAINLTAGAAYKLSEYVAPAATVATGTTFTTNPSVKVLDQWNNWISDQNTATAKVSLVTPAASGSVARSASTAVTAVNGVITFNNLNYVETPSTGYTLKYELVGGANNDRFTTSSAFEIVPGAPTQLAWVTEPAGARSNLTFTTQPVIQVQDAYGNAVRDANTKIKASVVSAPNSMVVTATDVFSNSSTGRATFTDLKLAGPAANYTLKFTAVNTGEAVDGVELLTTSTVELKHGIAAKMTLRDATGAAAGAAFTTSAVIRILDAQDNLVTDNFTVGSTAYNDATAAVTATLNNNAIAWLNNSAIPGDRSITLNAIGGVVDFSRTPDAGFGLKGAAGTYTISYSATTSAALSLTRSQSITLAHGAAAITTVKTGAQPQTSVAAGDVFAPIPVLELFDLYGNKVTTNSTAKVEVDLVSAADTNNVVATFGGTQSPSRFQAVSGEVSLAGLHFESTPANYKLKVRLVDSSFATISSVTTDTFAIVAAAPYEFVITSGPLPQAPTGVALDPAPTFEVRDRFGYKVLSDSATVLTASLTTNPGSGTITGRTTTAASGVAAFTNLKVAGAPGTYGITFSGVSNGVTLVAPTEKTFTLLAGAPNSLATQTAAAGVRSRIAIATAPVIRVLDSANNLVSANPEVTVSLLDENGNVPTNAFLSGDLTRITTNGLADFGIADANATLDPLVVRGPVGNYKLHFAIAAGANNSYPAAFTEQNITLTAGTASAMAIATQPAGGKTGDVLSTQPAVKLVDADGNLVLADSSTVISAVVVGVRTTVNGAPAPTDGVFLDSSYATLSAAPTQTAANGVARFSGLRVKGEPGNTYAIQFTSGSMAITTGDLIFTANDAAAISILTQPVGGVNGELLPTAPVVKLTDRFGYAMVNDSTTYVTAAISAGTSGSLSGITTAQASNGVVRFTGLRLSGLVKTSLDSTTPMDYKLTFSVGSSFSSPQTSAINLSPAAASNVAITRIAAGGVNGAEAGKVFATSPIIKITDFSGNYVNSAATITVTAANDDGSTGTIIGGPFTTATGLLDMTTAGLSGLIGNYTLTYNVAVARPGTTDFTFSGTQRITLTHGDLARIAIASGTQPNSGTATGETLNTTPVVKLLDASGNVVTRFANTQMTAQLVSAANGLAPTGTARQEVVADTATVTAVAGVADFGTLKVIGVPNDSYKLKFTLVGVSGVDAILSDAFSVTHGAPAAVVVTQAPVAGMKSGTTFTTPAKVAIKDAYGNLVTNHSTSYMVASLVDNANVVAGELNNSGANNKARIQVVNGIATFNELTLAGGVSEHYKMKFSLEGTNFETNPDDTLMPTNDLRITAGDPYQLKVITQAVARETGQELSQAPTIQLLDKWLNPVTTHAPLTMVMGVTPNSGAGAGELVFKDAQGNVLTNGNQITFANGIVTYEHVSLIGKPGVNYAFTFDIQAPTSILGTATTDPIRVSAAAPDHISVTTQVIGGITGHVLDQAPVITVYDGYGNVVTNAGNICVTVSGTTNTVIRSDDASKIACDQKIVNGQPVLDGKIEFIDDATVGAHGLIAFGSPDAVHQFKFTASIPAVVANANATPPVAARDAYELTADSNTFSLINDAAATFVLTTQPAAVRTGDRLTTQPVLKIVDQNGFLVKNDNTTQVSVSSTVFTGTNATGTVSGTTTKTAVAGVITFSDLEFVGTPGTLNSYKLVFASNGFTNVLSNAFSVTPGVPAALISSVTATVNRSGEVMPRQPAFRLVDRFGNLAYDDNGTIVTASIIATDGKGALSGQTTAVSQAGLVQFAGLIMSGFPGTAYDIDFSVSAQVAKYTEVGLKVFKQSALDLAYTGVSYVKNGTVSTDTKTVEDPAGTPSFRSNDTAVCTVNASTGVATIKGAGTCSIEMSVADHGFWLGNTITRTFDIAKANQPPLVFANSSTVVFGNKLALNVTQNAGSIVDVPTTPLVYTTSPTCREVGGTLFTGDVGQSCTVIAARAGNANFNAVEATQTISVTQADQPALEISSINSLKVGDEIVLHTVGGAGTGAVSYGLVSGTGVCDVSVSASVWRVTALAPGDCSVSAVKAASQNYKQSSTTQTAVTVVKSSQYLRFTSTIPMYPIVEPAPSNDPLAPAVPANAAFTYELSAVSTGTSTIHYSISASSYDNCSLSGTTLTFLADGDCEVTASAGENDDYLAAASVIQTITVGSLNQTINFAQLPDAQIGDANVIMKATTNAGQTVSFASATTTVCAIDDNGTVATADDTLAILKAGMCTVVANAGSTTNYVAAPTVRNTFRVYPTRAGAPFISSISASNRAVTATFTTPSFNGGSDIVAYRMVAVPTVGAEVETSACYQDSSGLNSCTLYGLTNDVSYTLKVAAVTDAGVGEESPASPSFTPAPSLMAVTSLIAVPTSTGGFEIKWKQPDALLGTFQKYDVYVKEKGGTYGVIPDKTLNTNQLLNVATLAPEELPGYVAPVIPTTTTVARVSNVSSASVSAANVSGSNSYATPVMRIASMRMLPVSSPSWSSAPDVTPVVTRSAVSDPNSTPSSSDPTAYEFKVVTVTDQATTESTANTASAVQTPNVAPGAPTRLTAVADAINKLTVSWGATTFDGGTPVTKYTLKVNGVTVCETVRPNTCVMPTLQYSTVYTVSVTATNAVGTSVASTFPVTTMANPTPPSSGGGAAPVPTPVPTTPPTPRPTTPPTPRPTQQPTPAPTAAPTAAPTSAPTAAPTAEPTSEPSAGPEPFSPTVNIPEINPGEPVANPAIGATGDDQAPPVAFDPTGSPEAISAAVDTATNVAALAGAIAAAAAGAAAAAAAAGASAASSAASAAGGAPTGGGTGGSAGGGSSQSAARKPDDISGGDGDDDSGSDDTEIDVVQDTITLGHEAWGDRLAMFALPFITFFDRRSHNAAERIGNFSPFFAKLINDGAYLRAMLGTLSFFGPIVAAIFGIIAVNENAAEIAAGDYSQIITPGWQWFLAIAILGAFDASAGFVGAMTFIIGSVITVGHIPDSGEIRTMMGIMLVSVAPALLTTGFRTIRKHAALDFNAWWERIADFVIAPFMAGWSVSAMVSGLPALAGLTLDTANHVQDFVVFIAVAVFVRVALEEFTAAAFPARLNKINPDEIPDPSNIQKAIVLVIKYFIWVFIGGALIGPSWQVWVGSALFVFPAVVGWYTDKFPNSPRIWRLLPTGIPGLAFTLLVASTTSSVVGAVLGQNPALGQWSFVILPIPMLAITVLGWFGRHGAIDADGNEEVRPGKRNKWLYRIGGIAVMFFTLKLAGVI